MGYPKEFLKALSLKYSLTEIGKILKMNKSTIHTTLLQSNFKKIDLIENKRLWSSSPEGVIISNYNFLRQDNPICSVGRDLLKRALIHKPQNISFFSIPYQDGAQ